MQNLTFPRRFASSMRLGQSPGEQLETLAVIIERGVEAIAGVYMRMCDLIRETGLADGEVRRILAPHFSGPRISEILRVANAPNEVYRRYSAGFFGFKAALRECRGWQVTGGDELHRRKLRRCAERLIQLSGGPMLLRLGAFDVMVQPAQPGAHSKPWLA